MITPKRDRKSSSIHVYGRDQGKIIAAADGQNTGSNLIAAPIARDPIKGDKHIETCVGIWRVIPSANEK